MSDGDLPFEEVADRTQAEMALKLSDSVRELIRNELSMALQDSIYMNKLTYSPASSNLAHAVITGLHSDSNFEAAVKGAMKTILKNHKDSM